MMDCPVYQWRALSIERDALRARVEELEEALANAAARLKHASGVYIDRGLDGDYDRAVETLSVAGEMLDMLEVER